MEIDPRGLWQGQKGEVLRMSADDFRGLVRQRESRARMQAILGIGLGIVMGTAFGYEAVFPAAAFHGSTVSRAGLAVLAVWSIWVALQTYRWTWPRAAAENARLGTTVAVYRGELERWRDYNRNLWRRSGLTVCFVGLAIVIGPGVAEAVREPRLAINMAPFFILLVGWILMYRKIRRERERRLTKELEALRTLTEM